MQRRLCECLCIGISNPLLFTYESYAHWVSTRLPRKHKHPHPRLPIGRIFPASLPPMYPPPSPQEDYWRERSSGTGISVEYGNDVEGTAFDPGDRLGGTGWNLNVRCVCVHSLLLDGGGGGGGREYLGGGRARGGGGTGKVAPIFKWGGRAT